MSYESDRSKSRIIGVDFARAVATGKHVMARSSRLTALDSLRGFGILLVVLGHASRSASLVSWIFSFHMPLFFIISGMLFHERQFLDSFKKKVTRLLIPYLFFGIVTFVYWALIERRFRVGVFLCFCQLLGELTCRDSGWLSWARFALPVASGVLSRVARFRLRGLVPGRGFRF